MLETNRKFLLGSCNIPSYDDPENHIRCHSSGNDGSSCYTYYTAIIEVSVLPAQWHKTEDGKELVVDENSDPWEGDAQENRKVEYSTRGDARDWQHDYDIGESYPCYYHPKDEWEVVFDKSLSQSEFVIPLVLSIVVPLLILSCGFIIAVAVGVTV